MWGNRAEFSVSGSTWILRDTTMFLAGFSEILPCGAAEPAAEGGDSPGGGVAGLHQGLAGRPTLPEREGEEKPRGRRHPVR